MNGKRVMKSSFHTLHWALSLLITTFFLAVERSSETKAGDTFFNAIRLFKKVFAQILIVEFKAFSSNTIDKWPSIENNCVWWQRQQKHGRQTTTIQSEKVGWVHSNKLIGNVMVSLIHEQNNNKFLIFGRRKCESIALTAKEMENGQVLIRLISRLLNVK